MHRTRSPFASAHSFPGATAQVARGPGGAPNPNTNPNPQVARGPGGAPVGCSVVEAFSKEVKPRELEEVLRLEYRSKLLNPK